MTTFAITALSSTASAQGTPVAQSWAVLPFSSGNDLQNESKVVAQLIATEFASAPGVVAQYVPQGAGCQEPVCAAQYGAQLGSERVVYGTINRLGTRLIVNASEVDVKTKTVLSGRRFSVNRVEELEEVSVRIAQALLYNKTTEDTAQLGAITTKEATPERRREGVRGTSFSLQGLLPFDESYADAGPGIGVALGYWYETKYFAIEPKLGVRFSTGTEATDNTFLMLPVDLNAYYIASLGDIAPFIGGGAGIRYMNEKVIENITTGNVIRQQYEKELSDSGWGFGLNARLGMMLLRTYSVRLAVSASYDLTLIKLNGRSNPQAAIIDFTVFF